MVRVVLTLLILLAFIGDFPHAFSKGRPMQDDLPEYLRTTEDGITLDRSYLFKYEKRSQIEWDKLDPDQWLSFPLWNKRRLELLETPLWRLKLRAKEHREIIGYLLACVGVCLNYPGEGETFYQVEHRSRFWERDELVTGKDSYAWMFLMDGTMVRLGPNSSVSLVEINISPAKNFIYARVNRGVVLWLSRSDQMIDQPLIRESDALFLPLSLMEANTFTWNVKKLQHAIRADVSLKWLPDDIHLIEQAKRVRLNQMIEENNKWVNGKPTSVIISLSNGILAGTSMRTEIVSLEMGESYIKNRKITWLNRQSTKGEEPITVTIFGGQGKGDEEQKIIEDGQWYKLSPRGEHLKSFNGPAGLMQHLNRMELVTARIPSIMIARELWLKKRSAHFFQHISSKELAVDFGHQLWDPEDQESGGLDINQREDFLLKELTRASQIRYRLRDLLQSDLQRDGVEVSKSGFGEEYYLRAYRYYTANHAPFFLPRKGEAGSNSQNSKFWLIRYYVDKKR